MAAPTTVIGIPIGLPSHRPEPKSGWRWPLAPIDCTTALEFEATGNESTLWFQAFVAGNTAQPAASGSRVAAALPAAAARRSAARATRRIELERRRAARITRPLARVILT